MLLDRLQSIGLPSLASSWGEKGKDEYQFNKMCAFLECEWPASRIGAIEAITSRFGITQKHSNQIQDQVKKADPRFLYDKTFVRTEVLP